ncbi:MAG TPA: hypothetical protein VGB13_11605, partial [Candidatus Krumholzibacteria bacterium]
CGGLSVERDVHRTMQTWAFQVPVSADGVGYFGSPFARVGPAIGKQDVDVYGTYRTATGVHRYPLIRYGLCDSSGRSSGPDGHLESFEGTDVGGRRDRKTVTLVIPAGHGLPAEGVVRRLMALAGETRFRLEACARMDKEVPAVDANPVGLSAEIMEAKSRALLWDRDGNLVNPKLGARNGRPIQAVLEERDLIAAATVQLQSPGDVVTEVTLTGTQQVTRTAEEQCGHESVPTEITVEAPYLPWHAAFSQSGACTLTPLSPAAGLAEVQPISVTRNIVERRCGVVLSETVEVWAWKRIEAARYLFTSGVRSCRVVYLDADGTINGSEPAFVESSERWRLISRTVKRHYYNQAGYGNAPSGTGEPWADAFSVEGGTFIDGVEQNPPPKRGYRLGSITDSYGWYQVRRALKEAIPATPWEEIDPSDGLALGNGEGVVAATESFMQTGREVEVIDSTDDGYLEAVRLYRYGFMRRPGNSFQYADGSESAQETENFGLTGLDQTTYAMPRGAESSHSFVSTRFAFDGAAARLIESQSGNAEGAPPPADRIPAEGEAAFDPTLFETPEESEAARTARATEAQQIKVRMTAPELLTTHESREVKTSSSWAETLEELAEEAARIILQSAAHGVLFSTPANFQLAEGHWIRLRCRPIGVDHDVEIQSVRYSHDGYRTPCVSAFVGKIYPELAA